MADYNNGSVTVTVSGGTAPYTYTLLEWNGSSFVAVPDNEYTGPGWSNPDTVPGTTYTFGNDAGPDQNTDIDVTGIRPGQYRVRVVDANQCELETQTITVTEQLVGGGGEPDACDLFENGPWTATDPSWSFTANGDAATVPSNDNGVLNVYVPDNVSQPYNQTEITVTATNGVDTIQVPYANPFPGNIYYFQATGVSAGTWDITVSVPSEGCEKIIPNISVGAYVEQELTIDGAIFSNGGSSVPADQLVAGTLYTVTVAHSESNLDGNVQMEFTLQGTSNYTLTPTLLQDAPYVFQLLINDTGSFTLGVSGSDSDNSPQASLDIPITVSSGSTGGNDTALYYFHGGGIASAWPYAVGGTLDQWTPGGSVALYLPDDQSGNATISDAMAYIIDNAGTAIPADGPPGGVSYTPQELLMSGTLTDDGTAGNTSWTFPALSVQDSYYLAVPSHVSGFELDLTSGAYMINSGGLATSAAGSIEFTYGGNQWTLYRMGINPSILGPADYGLNN